MGILVKINASINALINAFRVFRMMVIMRDCQKNSNLEGHQKQTSKGGPVSGFGSPGQDALNVSKYFKYMALGKIFNWQAT